MLKFTCAFYTPHKLSDLSVCQQLAEILTQPPASALKCDSVERAKMSFSVQAMNQCYLDEFSVFVAGKSGFLTHFSDWGPKLSIWRIYFTVKNNLDLWCQWIEDLAQVLPPYFGYACPQEEYNSKHLTLPRPRGISMAEFRQYLPGLYWWTVFGSELREFVEPGIRQKLSDWRVSFLDKNLISVRSSQAPALEDYTHRIEEFQRTAELINPGLFFNPLKTSGYRQSPQLLQALGDQD